MFLFKKVSDSLISSFSVSDVSESLRSLTKNERFAQKPMSEFPALLWLGSSEKLHKLIMFYEQEVQIERWKTKTRKSLDTAP